MFYKVLKIANNGIDGDYMLETDNLKKALSEAAEHEYCRRRDKSKVQIIVEIYKNEEDIYNVAEINLSEFKQHDLIDSYVLLQEPYPLNANQWAATAINKNDDAIVDGLDVLMPVYELIWDELDGWDGIDGNDACDWDCYAVKKTNCDYDLTINAIV